MKENILNRLISMYIDSMEEASSLWLSYCCCSSEEACERKEEDKKNLKEFIALCDRIRGGI